MSYAPRIDREALMATGDLEWLSEQIELKMERMRAKTERERAMLQRSFELLAKTKELLSEPAPEVWPSRQPQK
ncbi:hypothetical protein QA649_17980 [Bradyrhizobium sp. CB1717]|uniref:hypothetical protein n=1 Tax=Bradyrhizobium sp. CB1717 TaxID=3039154 RepID=UPI0024B12484|nr:hypothetical protein [Bradyrhizobium sp. CB1717]WFU28036.1 hypothetical protein QA649_17980 [Bradyrhizobium sp. CB1717]